MCLPTEKRDTEFVTPDPVPQQFIADKKVCTFTLIRYMLILSVKIDIQILPPQLAAIIFDPPFEKEIVISCHCNCTDPCHST